MTATTSTQRSVLSAIDTGPRDARAIAQAIGATYDSVHGRLRRLEDRGLVRRVGRRSWELTDAGRGSLGA